MFSRIQRHLAAWNVLVLLLILLLMGGMTYAVLSWSLMQQVDRSLSDRAGALLVGARELNEQEHIRLGSEGYSGGQFFLLIGPGGQVAANPQRVDLSGLAPSTLVTSQPTYRTETLGGVPVRLYLVPVQNAGGSTGALVSGQSIAAEQVILNRLLVVLVIGGLAGLVLTVAGGWFLAGRALIPIRDAFRRQQEFVADASHEFRTPLTVLHAAADMLYQHQKQGTAEGDEELIEDLRQETARLERLAGDLLTLARSDLGELGLAVGEVDLGSLAADVARRAMPLSQERGVTLSYSNASDPLVVEGDPDRLQQVLLILVDNALKHTPSGGTVSVTSKHDGGSAVVEVSDTGEGIHPEHLPRIFDRFYRADKSRSRAEGGSGLGLAIARSLVEAHHGRLSIGSEVATGTTASVRLPLCGPTTNLAGRMGQAATHIAHRPAND